MITYTQNFRTILLPILHRYTKEFGAAEVHKYFFEVLDETKAVYQKKHNDKNGQKWRNEGGKMFEQLVAYYINDELRKLKYETATGDAVEKAKSGLLEKIGHKIAIKYGKYFVIPDSDIIVFEPQSKDVKAIISCKASLRERFAQTLYWKLKLSMNTRTKYIKMYFVTVDKEWNKKKTAFKKASLDILEGKEPTKPRILLEHEMDGVYVTRDFSGETQKVKQIDKFLADLRTLLA